MNEPAHQHRTGGIAVRVRDCRIWAEISYLDSPSNYREYLPEKLPEPLWRKGDFVISDDDSRFPSGQALFRVLFLLTCVVLILVASNWN